jgi:GTP 3',8-cyclase
MPSSCAATTTAKTWSPWPPSRESAPGRCAFIEMMPFGDVADFQQAGIVPEAELRATIAAGLGPLELLNGGQLDGEARLYRLHDGLGSIGFISSVTEPFCAGCSRARLTADGRLRLCLLRENEVNLLAPLRAGATDAEMKALIEESIWWKPWGHRLEEHIVPLNRVMSEIGG